MNRTHRISFVLVGWFGAFGMLVLTFVFLKGPNSCRFASLGTSSTFFFEANHEHRTGGGFIKLPRIDGIGDDWPEKKNYLLN